MKPMDRTATGADWQAWDKEFGTIYAEAYARVRRIEASKVARIRKLTNEAGLDGGIFPIHLHNAWVSREYGKPWKGVDYQKVRQARRLERSLYDADRILHRWYRRMMGLEPEG